MGLSRCKGLALSQTQEQLKGDCAILSHLLAALLLESHSGPKEIEIQLKTVWSENTDFCFT